MALDIFYTIGKGKDMICGELFEAEENFCSFSALLLNYTIRSSRLITVLRH
jgi:hypothetical protein